jgi:hypothetical protein
MADRASANRAAVSYPLRCLIFVQHSHPGTRRSGRVFPRNSAAKKELASPAGIVLFKENHMADNKNPNEKQPGEKPEGKHHYNPGNQSGKEAEIVPKEDAHKEGEARRA